MGRPRRVAARIGAASIALAAIAGCSSGDDSGSDAMVALTTVAATPAPTATPPPSAAPTTAATVPPTSGTVAPAPDPAGMLASALAALGPDYRFDSTITVNGATAATASGDRVGDASRFDVVSNATQVSYVVLPDASYVRQGDGAWEALQDAPAAVDPIDALASPIGVTLVSGGAPSAELDVVVDAAALGVGGDGQVTVRASLTSGTLTSVYYENAANGQAAQSLTTFGPVGDSAPVVAPI